MFQKLKSDIEKLLQLSNKEWQQFENAFTLLQVPKRFQLVKEGDISREIYYIKKGIIRYFYNKDGEEITGFIFTENLFASSYESFLRQTPSNQILETIEDCELLVITYASLHDLYQKVPKINILTRLIAEQRFINAQQILSSYILDSPEERYIKFSEKYPEILQRVPQHIIASFLGITPVSLSRIRNRLVGK